eukprot:3497618-Lingulodinium_polyedra.AAC.1
MCAYILSWPVRSSCHVERVCNFAERISALGTALCRNSPVHVLAFIVTLPDQFRLCVQADGK